MNTSRSTKRFLYTSSAALSPLLSPLMLCSLKDVYMHVTKANHSVLIYRFIQICQLVWVGYGCGMASISKVKVC